MNIECSSKPCRKTQIQDDTQPNSAFHDEFLSFLRCRESLRRFAPMPDQFPLFCAMVDALKLSYVTLPRVFRWAKENKYISFSCFGMNWFVHINKDMLGATDRQIFIDVCAVDKRKLVTVAVGFNNDCQETEAAQTRVTLPLISLGTYKGDIRA